MSSKSRKWHIKYDIKSRPNIYFITINENKIAHELITEARDESSF